MDTQKTNKEQIWEAVLTEIETIISKANFITWFQKTNLEKIEDGTIFLNVPNSFTKEWIKNKYSKHIISVLRKTDPKIRSIEYIICSNPKKFNTKNTFSQKSAKIKKITQPKEEQTNFNTFSKSKETLNSKYIFDSFIVGSFNELAHAAAQAVTKNPGLIYNPLFIYGGVGLGKTHLLQAIGNKLKEKNQNYQIQYTTLEKFANDLIQSIQNNTIYEFKEKYKKNDLLIIDDIQFLSNKTKTQEELFHIFNTLYEKNKQIIFSSDRPPKSIPDLEARLRSRFEGGMMTDISEPEYEARIAILKSKIQNKNLNLPEKMIDYIASNIKNNIRELEGALNILSAQTKLLGRNLNLEELKEIFNKHIIYSKKKVSFKHVIKTVAQFYEIKEISLFEKSRRKEFVLPRQIAMYLLREDFNGSYPYIGQKLGGRDHTTVMHAYLKISKDIKTNQQIKEDINQIRGCLYE